MHIFNAFRNASKKISVRERSFGLFFSTKLLAQFIYLSIPSWREKKKNEQCKKFS